MRSMGGNRVVVVLTIIATFVAVAVVACAPGHVLMGASSADNAVCAFAGHSISAAGIDAASPRSAPGPAAAGLLATVLSGMLVFFAVRTDLPGRVPVHIPKDLLHGRLLI